METKRDERNCLKRHPKFLRITNDAFAHKDSSYVMEINELKIKC